MSYELQMPNGEVVTVKDDSTTPEAAFADYQNQVMKEKGADPNFKMDIEGKTREDLDKRLAQMPYAERLAAGYDAGLANVGKQVGNIAGMVSDESLNEDTARDRALRESKGGGLGSFTGEMAALLPLGGVGAGARAAGAGRILASALEGASGGAVLGGPGNRGKGAALGAGTGAALTILARTGARLVKEGLLKKDAGAAAYQQELKNLGVEGPTPATAPGRVRNYLENKGVPLPRPSSDYSMPFIPATKLAPGGKVAGFVESIGTAFPRAKAVYEQQAGQATKDFQEAALRKAYPQVADQVAMKLRTQGYKEAVNFGNQATASLRGPMKNFTKPSRTYVTEAGKRRMNEEVTPTVLKKTILKEAGTSPLPTPADTQLLGFTQKAEQFAAPSEKLSTPVTRGTVYELMRGVKDLLGPVLGSVPVLNKAMQPFASKGFQNWLSGNTKGMLRLQAAVDSRRGQDVMAVMAALRRTYAAEAGASENE